ncbi:hypothetical protein LCGC14_1056190 [marine sediment metagenome]|uniref:Uncharacterized protein n=1 Tax=marine sediment metagenome TaxID=412755 RepID=A0A0F9Q5J4_9ZZZZ
MSKTIIPSSNPGTRRYQHGKHVFNLTGHNLPRFFMCPIEPPDNAGGRQARLNRCAELAVAR